MSDPIVISDPQFKVGRMGQLEEVGNHTHLLTGMFISGQGGQLSMMKRSQGVL